MNKIYMFLVLVFAACGPVVAEPETEAPAGPPGGVTESVAPRGADTAIAVIEQTYFDLAGAVLPDDTTVHWTQEFIPCEGDQFCSGLTFSCQDIWVAEPQEEVGITMALAHELAHCALRTLTGDGDATHSNQTWWSDYGYVHQAQLAVNQAVQ